MKELEIYWNNLTPEFQEKLLKHFNIKDASEHNWDFFPIAIIEIEVEEETKPLDCPVARGSDEVCENCTGQWCEEEETSFQKWKRNKKAR